MKIWITALCFLHVAVASASMQEAADRYDEGDYAGAVAAYEQLEDDGYYSFSLFYNKGVSHLELNEIGQAIAYFEKALLLDPGNEDALHNLEVARQRTLDQVEYPEKKGISTLLSSIVMAANMQTWAMVAVALFIAAALAIVMLAFRKRKRKVWMYTAFGCIASAMLFTSLAVSQYHQLSQAHVAVIMTPKVVVRNAPTPDADEVFTLHEGTRVDVLQIKNGWLEIELNNNQGWILEEFIQAIRIF